MISVIWDDGTNARVRTAVAGNRNDAKLAMETEAEAAEAFY